MPLFDQSKRKLRNIEGTVHNLLEGDFPLEAGERALRRLLKVFEDLDLKLDRANRIKDATAIASLAGQINLKINQVLPVLGFILRSTNVRNAFELLEPFQAVSDCLLQGSPRLILSSEWDYVPFAYPQSLEDLQNFVLIGMPASECGNALLSPLAAHELGHALWINRGITGAVSATLQLNCEGLYFKNEVRFRQLFPEYKSDDIVAKDILPDSIAMSMDYAVYQAEELFCDMFAYAVFGESYLYAFSYILAPGIGRRPSSKYPTYKTRVSTLQDVALKEGVTLPGIGELSLSEDARSGFPRDRFIIEMAEGSVATIVNALWDAIKDLIRASNLTRPVDTYATMHLKEYRMGVPGHEPRSLGDIVNAGWRYYREDILPGAHKTNSEEAFFNLNELLFKTMEVLEYRRRVI